MIGKLMSLSKLVKILQVQRKKVITELEHALKVERQKITASARQSNLLESLKELLHDRNSRPRVPSTGWKMTMFGNHLHHFELTIKSERDLPK